MSQEEGDPRAKGCSFRHSCALPNPGALPGTAGHNGLRSIDQHLGPDFRRVRLGIGHPGHKDRVTGYVLGNYAKSEMDPLADMLGAISAEAEWLAKADAARFMSEVALRLAE